jgi:tetratricopeptide (TPR) repeat protein
MDPGEIDSLVRRLVVNPHDEEALAYAHRAGSQDPKAYAFLLEKVGSETEDPVYASHWLSEAANVWSTTLGDAHRAARVLMMAVDKDPTQQVAANRLAQLYRDKGDVKALVAMLDRRARLLTPLLSQNDEIRPMVAGLHEELGTLWSSPPLSQPKKAVENYRRAIELDPGSAFAIYSVREIYKAQSQWDDAVSMYAMELAVEKDPVRRLALLRDEAATRKTAGDLAGATRALMQARELDQEDPAIAQELAGSVLDRLHNGEAVPDAERQTAVELLVGLAEVYPGEHGFAYASGALDGMPGHDRAVQLYAFYARTLQQEQELSSRFLAYLESNPNGAMSQEARQTLSASYEAAGDAERAAAILDPSRPVGSGSQSGGGSGSHAQNAVAPQAAPSRPEDRRASNPPPLPNKRPSVLPRDPERLQGVLDAAQMLSGKGKKAEALAKYKEVLDADPAHPEALSWVEDYLRSKRDYAQLRDVLWAAARAMTGHDSLDARKERLREIAGLCEGNLRDVEGAVTAWKQLLAIDRADESARTALTRILEKSQRWDDLAHLYEQEANVESDVDAKIALEKKLATLQETKRKDFTAAAEAWARICDLTPDDDRALGTASRLFEKAGQIEQAAQVIADHAAKLDDAVARGSLLERLGELREQLGDMAGAGEAYQDAADAQHSAKLWEAAERCFVHSEKWEQAANAAGQRAQLSGDAKQQAEMFARASEHLIRAGDEEGALARLEQATDLDPTAEEHAQRLLDRYQAAEKWDKLGQFLSQRGDRLTDKPKRVAIRRQAATLFATRISDKEAAREQWLKVLEDGDDREALEKLIDVAVEREDHTEATTLLRRLGGIAIDKADKARVALREAELLAEGMGDVDTAVARYETILSDLDPTCRPALQAIADLQEARDNPAAAADALERELKLVADVVERGQIAARLARLYEQSLDDPRSAIRALDVVRKADLEDFDALTRLCNLCEKVEQWDRVAELLAQRIEVEGDEQDASLMTQKLAGILADKLDRGDEALAALTELADQGDAQIRVAYVELGDRLGWKGIVATKLVDWWFEAKNGPERMTALRGAFERFCDVGRDQDAVRVAIEIVRSKGADRALAERLEGLAVKTSDHDALSTAHDLLTRELSGAERATELVRQAELRVRAGMPPHEAIQHGEAGLTSVAPQDAEPLLERLAALALKPIEVIDLYERQVSRSKAPADRVKALGRAAQIAAARGQLDRARGFFDIALAGAPTEETLTALEQAAKGGDASTGGERLRRTLAASMGGGGQGARDGGKSRGALLRRAAKIAQTDLGDLDQAFAWLGDALIAHVEGQTLDALEELSRAVHDPRRAEETITRALSEVFDGPLVRQLLARRAKLRREQMSDKAGAAADLKKLHDLSPNDQAVMDELSALLTELGDYRSMVQLYEDQILRGKDMGARSELARKVARMWEEQLQDPREAADAWRRVLRMRQGDTEATAGLDRAKSNMLKKPDPNASDAYAPPKLASAPASIPTPVVLPVMPKEATRDATGDDVHAAIHPASSGAADAVEGPETETVEVSDFASPHETPVVPGIRYPSEALQTERALASTDEHETTGTLTDLSGMPASPPPSVSRSSGAASSRGRRQQGYTDEKTAESASSAPRSTRPPPLPGQASGASSRSKDRPSDPLTSPGRRLDAPTRETPLSGVNKAQGNDRLIRTDENPLVDFQEETIAGSIPAFSSETVTVAEEEDVIVVDDIAEELDDESAPHTVEEGASASTVPPPNTRH